jgi:hypothetical protein
MRMPVPRKAKPQRTRSGTGGATAVAGTLAALMLAGVTTAQAACPQELAVYTDRDKAASLEFRPAPPEAAVRSSTFRVLFAQGDLAVDGIVLWTDEVPRPFGMLMHDCPEGDVTGEEIAACTVWQGVIYGADAEGRIGLLAKEGPAAERLLLPDFGPSVRHSALYGPGGISLLPFDVFELSGCQE